MSDSARPHSDQTSASDARSDTDARKALLEVDDVTIRFGGVTALDSVSFDIKQGEILGLIGPNGAGKTTCFNVMTGVYQATSGQIRFDGQPLAKLKRYKHHQARDRPDLPEHPAVPGDDRTGERPGRCRRQQQGRPAERAVPHRRCTAAPSQGLGRGGLPAPRLRRGRRPGRRAGREPLLRRPAPAGDRAGHGDQAQAAVPRRAGGRVQPGREAAPDGPDPQGTRRGLHRAADRARHAAGDGRHRPDRRAGVRPQDRRGRCPPRSATTPRSSRPTWEWTKKMLLEVEGLCVNYGHIEAIRDISFGVDEGEVDHAHRGQRRRQDHDAEDPLGAAQGPRRARSSSTARTSPSMPPYERVRARDQPVARRARGVSRG